MSKQQTGVITQIKEHLSKSIVLPKEMKSHSLPTEINVNELKSMIILMQNNHINLSKLFSGIYQEKKEGFEENLLKLVYITGHCLEDFCQNGCKEAVKKKFPGIEISKNFERQNNYSNLFLRINDELSNAKMNLALASS